MRCSMRAFWWILVWGLVIAMAQYGAFRENGAAAADRLPYGGDEMTMICGNCNQPGIRWVGPFSNLTHTECPHCGGTNCQQVDQLDDPEEEVECGCGRKSGPPNFDDGRYYCGSQWCMP